jgi:drug/metabolite transporter (DMT)-like permease
MTGTIADALAALVCYGLGDFIYKRAARAGLPSDYFIMAQGWFFCTAILVYAWLTGTLHLASAALWGAVAGVLVLVAFYNYARSLNIGSVSVIAPVFRLNFLVTVALAIGVLHEKLTVPKGLGFLLALATGWLLLGGPARRDVDPAAARRSLIQALVATVALGTANFCYKLGLMGGATPETMLAVQAVVFTGLATAATALVHGRIRPPRGFAWHSGPAALVLVAAFLFLLHGLKTGQASVVVPISQMGFVVAAVLGVIVFKEDWTARKIAGLCTALAALALLTMG